MYAIVNWMDTWTAVDLSVVTNEDGTPILFNDKAKATRYAREELNGKWQIIKL